MITKVALCGIGGYGEQYLKALLDENEASSRGFRLVAGIDPAPERCSRYDLMRQRKIPVYSTLDEFFAEGKADLVILSSPMHYHAEQACKAVLAGADVLCEKPLCPTIEEADAMARAEQKTGRSIAIGYQWSYSTAITRLKTDILAGRLGRPVRLKTLASWPRYKAYYERNEWAGKIQDEAGRFVYDSPIGNGMAHFLHNMLYVLGPAPEKSVKVKSVEAELYRAYPIENFDTVALRVTTDDGTPLLFYGTHVSEFTEGPMFDYEFEKARVRYFSTERTTEGLIKITWADGREEVYGSPDQEDYNKLWDVLSPAPSRRCGVEACRAHVACVSLVQRSNLEIDSFSSELVQHKFVEGTERLYVSGLEREMRECFERNLLPREAGKVGRHEEKCSANRAFLSSHTPG